MELPVGEADGGHLEEATGSGCWYEKRGDREGSKDKEVAAEYGFKRMMKVLRGMCY